MTTIRLTEPAALPPGASASSGISRLRRLRPLGAITAQMSQALASFTLQVLAARELGASGLGLFALVLSVLLMVTAVGSGLVGDSLTILDRQHDPVRSGLQRWGMLTVVAAGLGCAVAAAITNTLSQTGALLFGAALAAFLVEDALRRLLMACMKFWSLVIVDGTAMLVYLATLGALAFQTKLTIEAFLLALLLGQIAAAVVAVLLLPPSEKRLAPWSPAAMGVVGRFGFWRGAQQSIRPTMLTVARVLIVLAVGRVAFGQLEAGRVYMAPAMLVVQGVGSYLMSSYARGKQVDMTVLLRRADRASALMLVSALGLGVLATALAPVLGPVITRGSYHLSPVAVLGWAVYAASAAAVMPFASLAAVRGRQGLVVGLRLSDSTLSILCLCVVLFALGGQAEWAPFPLAAGSFLGGFIVRQWVLKPLLERNQR